ncbi:MFS transporter, partial [Kibdelosporangium lantanae]
MMGMFVAILASTVVANALPRVVADLGGSQSSYTWVVTTELLAMTATVPLWGKLSDLYNKKLLVQLSLSMFVIGSLIAGFSGDIGVLIGSRVVQGIGAGGLTALAQVIMASIVSPRE